MKKISVVIPMYYEEEVANECYTRMKNVLSKLDNYTYEIIFVNDGSKDKTLEILTNIANIDKNVKILSLKILKLIEMGRQCRKNYFKKLNLILTSENSAPEVGSDCPGLHS